MTAVFRDGRHKGDDRLNHNNEYRCLNCDNRDGFSYGSLSMLNFDDYSLGETDDTVYIETSEDHRAATLQMAWQCRRSMEIISHRLDPAVYDTPEFIEATKRLILQHYQVRIRILVFEPVTIVRYGHRLVDLMHNLPTYIEFRKPGFEYDGFNEAVFIADSTGYVLRTTAERYEGTLNFNDRRGSTILRRKFEEMWQRSRQDPNLKRISL